MRKVTCCKDCQERHVGCHGECEKYKAEHAAIIREVNLSRKRKFDHELCITAKRPRRRKVTG